MGIVSSVAPDVLPGCKTGSLSLCFADGEEKRHPENKSDEYSDPSPPSVSAPLTYFYFVYRTKLLCVMSARIHHIKDSLNLSAWNGKHDNLPLPVAVGTLRCGAKWSVYLMWREGDDQPFQWAKIIKEMDLSDPEEFLHYTTFTFRLFRYGQLFKDAVKKFVVDVCPPTPVIHSFIVASFLTRFLRTAQKESAE
jgi:hypothetical protein